MYVTIVFEPDENLGPDPLDRDEQPRAIGEFIGPLDDVVVIRRHPRTGVMHVYPQGGFDDPIVLKALRKAVNKVRS